MEKNKIALEKSKFILSEAQAENVKASQMVIEEETEKLKLDQEVEKVKKKADHAVDLEADSVINEHLRNIESLISDPSPEGFGLSSRYCFAFHYDMLFLVL